MLNVVQPFELDSADMAITDIKGIYRAPIWWWGFLRWVLLALAVAGIGVGGYYLITYLQSRMGKREEDAVAAEPLRPAEEVALEKLDIIREQKIWQTGQIKEYHTQLTDVVREYIDRRFEVSSAEQTSDETLRAMRPLLNDKKDLYEQLRKTLTNPKLREPFDLYPDSVVAMNAVVEEKVRLFSADNKAGLYRLGNQA